MNCLAIDTTSTKLTAVMIKDEMTFCREIEVGKSGHSGLLMPTVDSVLKEAGLNANDLNAVCAVVGPGSFTGIRIGISAVKGFAVGTGKKMLALTSFEVIAYNVADENFYTVIDAAHGHYYACGFSAGKKVASAPAYLSEEQVLALDSPLYGFEELNLPRYTKINVEDGFYRAVIANAENLSDDIAATYLRKSQAEEGRK